MLPKPPLTVVYAPLAVLPPSMPPPPLTEEPTLLAVLYSPPLTAA